MFMLMPYPKPEGLTMTSIRFSTLGRAAAGAAAILSLFAAPALAGSNPLEDFKSETLTSDFRSSYASVGNATINIDVPYGLDGAQKYDVYLPEGASHAPIVIMVHGGAWTGGDKQADNVADAKAMDLVNGKGDMVDVVTAISQTQLAMETMVTVRDRVISAYEEIMRMPI